MKEYRRPLAKALGQYVPAFSWFLNVFRQVESIPLTKNGKIDRRKLLHYIRRKRNEFYGYKTDREHTQLQTYVFDLDKMKEFVKKVQSCLGESARIYVML